MPKNGRSVILIAGVIIALLILVFNVAVTVKAGEAGVLFRPFSGGVDVNRTYDEGFHIIAPWNNMITYEVRQQEVLETMAVLSSNGLEITVDVSIWYQPEYQDLPKLHKEKGQNYLDRIVKPSMRSATRSVIGRYTPEEIYSTKRDAIQKEIFEETARLLDNEYVQVNAVLVRDITLPSSIKQAIENKLTQEQASLEYEFRLEREQKEAERIRIQAEGKAEANKILNASLTENILKEKGIQATLELASSPNSKVVVIGNSDGLPIILNDK
ncbi:MAG TPA: prohibitin family protein [Chitinophagales bacterium]|nr:prohibitin family protein [Chitinophagales bacterium]